MRTLFLTFLLTSLIGGALGVELFNGAWVGSILNTTSNEEYDPFEDPAVSGRLRVPVG